MKQIRSLITDVLLGAILKRDDGLLVEEPCAKQGSVAGRR